MAKINVFDKTGKKAKDIETTIFNGRIRKDIVQKIVESEKTFQPHAPFYLAGQQTSASGNVRHLRHAWKSDRGRGMARIPKKRMTRRGNRFHWVGAVVPGTRGGRRAHPPKLISRIGKINKKELIVGLKSAIAMSAQAELIKEKYDRLKDKEISTLPLIIESKSLELKTKDFRELLKKILGNASVVAFQEKSVRAGKGKLRGRKHKQNAGLLLVIGKDEEKSVNGIDTERAVDVSVTNLASNGARLVVFTEEGVKDMEARLKGKQAK